jgi:hypothetical protein
MFGLPATDLPGEILDRAGGPASFNAESSARGHRVLSCDLLFEFSAGGISERILATFDQIASNARANRDRFLWHEIESPRRLGEVRMRAMQRASSTISDRLGSRALLRRGIAVSTLRGPRVRSRAYFALLVCLFRPAFQVFHVAAIEEMYRVGREARVFPLLESYGAQLSCWNR